MSDTIPFSKMSGAGNDFIVLGRDDLGAIEGPLPAWVRRVCRRRLSVGADGVLAVGSEDDERVAVRFFNPDGSEAFCGNGTRCAARWAYRRGLAPRVMRLATAAGEVVAEVDEPNVLLRLAPPRSVRPFRIDAAGEAIEGSWIDAGCPHAVIDVADVRGAPLERWGPSVRRASLFGEPGANVDLVSRTAERRLEVRTWERGVEAETLACGSAALAVAFAARIEHGGDEWVVVPASGIPLDVTFGGSSETPDACSLAGDARIVLEGRIGGEAVYGYPDPED